MINHSIIKYFKIKWNKMVTGSILTITWEKYWYYPINFYKISAENTNYYKTYAYDICINYDHGVENLVLHYDITQETFNITK